MASIYLVRHGQAGFGKLNYDQLSDTGHQQGELVGQRHWHSAVTLEAGLLVHGRHAAPPETLAGAHKSNTGTVTGPFRSRRL